MHVSVTAVFHLAFASNEGSSVLSAVKWVKVEKKLSE
jgi:hypothetical protein